MDTIYNVLICDDDPDILAALKIYLTSPDLRLFEARNGKEALDTVGREEIHLILLDVMMPVMDGISAMVKIREISNCPILLLTAKSEESDKIIGLDLGADDYITKPYHPAEVTARVRSHLRRYLKLGAGQVTGPVLTLGGIELNDVEKRVRVDGAEVTLTPTEFDILRLLMKTPGKVYSPADIYRKVWNGEPFGSEKTVVVHIRHLREKIEIDPSEPRCLKAVWGQGYYMEKEKRK